MLNLYVHPGGVPHRSLDGGRTVDYRPAEVIDVFALRVLAIPRTWRDLENNFPGRKVGWWREQVFALEWLGLAEWVDGPPQDQSQGWVTKAPTGTWRLTSYGKHELAKLS